MKKSNPDLTEQVEQLQREVASLRSAFSLFEGLASPRMARLYQQSVGGLTAVASDSDWRLRGFYAVEKGSGSHDVAWTQFDQPAAVHMLLLGNESYSCSLRLIRTPHIELPGSVILRINGQEIPEVYDEDEQAYTFTYQAAVTGWHAFGINSRQCLQPSLNKGKDVRRLGVLFRSLTLVPLIA